MKYIEKHPEAAEVVAYEAELRDNSLDKDSLFDKTMRPALGGSDVYEEEHERAMVSKKERKSFSIVTRQKDLR